MFKHALFKIDFFQDELFQLEIELSHSAVAKQSLRLFLINDNICAFARLALLGNLKFAIVVNYHCKLPHISGVILIE